MIRRSVFSSLGFVALPAALLLAACPPAPPPPPPPPPPTTPAPPPAPPTTPAPPPAPPPNGTQFVATFDTAGDFFNRFQREVFFGLDIDRSSTPQWQGDHSMGCEGPTTQRTVHSDGAHNDEMFWWCAPGGDASKGHIMTSMYTAGYAQVLFAPNRSFNRIRKVCWDQSMVGLPRKWTQVVIVPEALYQANGRALHYVNPGLQPVPATDGLAIGALPRDAYGEPDGSDLRRTEEWAAGRLGGAPWDSYLLTFTNGSISQWSRQGEESYFNAINATDKAPRFQQCFEDLENGTIRHTNILGNGQARTVTLAGSIPNGPARVIFQDDTYDSFKTDLGDRSGGSNPLATWHWDNIFIT